MKGFGTGVGGFSNIATIMYSMAANFNKPGCEDQYKEIMTRIKLLREIVGQEIDRIKGADKPSIPADWKKIEQIDPSDTPEIRTQKFRHNAMVIKKKPYFLRYKYKELNLRYKQFEASYNRISCDMFGIKFKKLLKKPIEEQTDEEKNLIRRYQKYSPVINSPCTMNKLCREIESVDFDIKFFKDADDAKKKPVSKLPTFEKQFAATFSQDRLDFVNSLYSEYTSKKQIKHVTEMLDSQILSVESDDYREIRKSLYDFLISELQTKLSNQNMSGEEFLFYCYRASLVRKQFNWGFAWDILGDQVIHVIPQGRSFCPIYDPSSAYEYLGVHYSLKDISNESELMIDKLINSMFGQTEGVAEDLITTLLAESTDSTNSTAEEEKKEE